MRRFDELLQSGESARSTTWSRIACCCVRTPMTRSTDWSRQDWQAGVPPPDGDLPPLESRAMHKPPKFKGGKK